MCVMVITYERKQEQEFTSTENGGNTTKNHVDHILEKNSFKYLILSYTHST